MRKPTREERVAIETVFWFIMVILFMIILWAWA